MRFPLVALALVLAAIAVPAGAQPAAAPTALTLDEAMRLAEAAHPSVLAREAQLAAAEGTQREAAALLLGEQGVITAVGLPFGMALGIGLTLYFVWMLSTQMWRMPYVMTGANLVGAMGAVAAAAAASGAAVAWRLRHMDLVGALKARE